MIYYFCQHTTFKTILGDFSTKRISYWTVKSFPLQTKAKYQRIPYQLNQLLQLADTFHFQIMFIP